MIHMIMVLMIQIRYCNHRSRGKLNGTGSAINTSQKNILDRLLLNQPIECVSETESEVKLRELSNCMIHAYSVENTLQAFSFKYNTQSYYSKQIIF